MKHVSHEPAPRLASSKLRRRSVAAIHALRFDAMPFGSMPFGSMPSRERDEP